VITLLVLPLLWQAQADPTPRAVVEQARLAVERDSAGALAARWNGRLRRDSTDGIALLGLATLARLTFDDATADRTYALLLSGASRTGSLAGYAALGHAALVTRRGRYDLAARSYTDAAGFFRKAAEPAGEAETLIGLSRIHERTRGTSAALELVDRAAALISHEEPGLQGMVRCRRAAIWAQASGGPAVEEALGGLALVRGGRIDLEAQCQHALATALVRDYRIDSAFATMSRAVELYRRARDRSALASLLQWRGWLLGTMGYLAHSRSDLAEAVTEGAEGRHTGAVAWSLVNLAGLSARLGDLATGARHGAEATALMEKLGDAWGMHTSLNAEGNIALHRGDLDAAEKLFERVWQWSGAAGLPNTQIPAGFGLIATARRRGDWAAVDRWFAATRDVARAKGMRPWQESLVLAAGTLALARGDLDAAQAQLQAFLPRIGPDQFGHVYRTRIRLAEVYARRGDVARAEAELMTATEGVERWRASLDDRALRLLVFQESDTYADPDEGVATVLSVLVRHGRVASAFHLAERRRARELADRLLRADALAARPPGAATVSRRPLERAALGRGVVDVVGSGRIATAESLAAGLPDARTALLEYVTGLGGEPTTLFVVTRAGLTAHTLPPIDSLSPDIDRFIGLLEAGGDAEPLAIRLGAALLDPALRQLPPSISRLVVVPDGALHRVPFDALMLEERAFVIERFALGLAPSATAALSLWGRSPTAGATRLLAFADPRFAATIEPAASAAAVYRSSFDSTGGLTRLRYTEHEARAAARYANDARVLLRDAASEAELKRQPLDGYRILHFATHALVDDHSEARTALALSPGEGEDGYVGPGDLAALRLNADLVVLSACRTARGLVLGGEGLRGLASPLIEAGARAVVATVWPIEDRATVQFVENFYGALARGESAADALREAKLAALRRGAPPREWAAFTLYGDPLVRVPLEAPGRVGPSAAAVAVLLAILVTFALVLGRGVSRRPTE
jgi:tetratricopeptide (TPR) repeat protein